MKLRPTPLEGVIVIEPRVFRDERGFFLETYHAERYAEAGIRVPFVQDNHSYSAYGTLRGLHAQYRRPQGKLVRVVAGEVFDVVIDVRPGSSTLGRWHGTILSGENFRQLYIPPGCAHGFCVTSEWAHFEYKCTALYDPGGELTIAWNDPAIGIRWPLEDPVLSPKDREGLTFDDAVAFLAAAERE